MGGCQIRRGMHKIMLIGIVIRVVGGYVAGKIALGALEYRRWNVNRMSVIVAIDRVDICVDAVGIRVD